MEHTSLDSDVEYYKFHSGAPTSDAYTEAHKELLKNTNSILKKINSHPVKLQSINRPVIKSGEVSQSLITAYSSALIKEAKLNEKIIALDADLILDTGLIPFSENFPDRFVECGIAEQDMVSQAGGMALVGMLPIVHSFSCFLSARPNEQIYNNATEGKKIIYVGSLAGLLPAGPGHSHQAVRDISTIGSIPNFVVMEPSCGREVELLLRWAISDTEKSSYLRLVSIPSKEKFTLPDNYYPSLGKGVVIAEGDELVVFCYGPIFTNIAISIREKIKSEFNFNIRVVNMPWLNYVDKAWLRNELKNIKIACCIENHYVKGGLGDRIASSILELNLSHCNFHKFGIEDIPKCGTNDEVLIEHQLDVNSLSIKIIGLLEKIKSL